MSVLFYNVVNSIEVLGIEGKVLETHVVSAKNEEEIQINISDFNSGLYFIKLNTSKSKRFGTKKVLKINRRLKTAYKKPRLFLLHENVLL